MNVEFWTRAPALPRMVEPSVRRAEAEGWTGVTLGDSQNVSGELFVALGTAVSATNTVRLSSGVTNPLTRHPAVTAAGMMCANIESGGRVELGIGRGDSSLAHIGIAPASVSALRDFILIVRDFMRGEAVPIERVAHGGARIDSSLPLGNVPGSSRMRWLDELPNLGVTSGTESIPIWVGATGPKVIQMAAVASDRVTLAVGADPARIKWAVGLARDSNPDVAIGAYVTVVVDDDRNRGFNLSRGRIATFARFSAMHGRAYGSLTEDDRLVIEQIPAQYDMDRHGQNATQGNVVTPEFADRFAILGPPELCVERLIELVELGVDRFHVGGVSRGEDPEVARATHCKFVETVMGRVRDE